MILDVDDLEILAWIVMGDDMETAIERVNARYDREAELKWDLDEAIEKKLGCTFHKFCEVIETLLPMTPKAKSVINGEKYHAFLNKNGDAIIKMQAED